MEGIFCFSTFRLPAISLAGMKVLEAIRLRGGKACVLITFGNLRQKREFDHFRFTEFVAWQGLL